MNFLAPAALGLAVLLPVIVAMYLLKLRRSEQIVSSVFLWRRTVRDVEANAPWQRLRRNLLLLLQLLFLAGLILALARPFHWREGLGGQAAILILDVSASMAATDVQPNRLEAAKSQARQIVDSLPDGARTTVIAAGEGAEVLAASAQDRRIALNAIDSIEVTTGSGDLSAALQLASAIAARQPDTEIIVLSDGRAELPERLAVKGRLRYLPIGLRGENQAISLLTLEPARGAGLTAFVQVSNYGQAAVNRTLEIYADGALFNAYTLELPGRGQGAVLAEDLPLETQLVEARLAEVECLPAEKQDPCYGDGLPTDDRAWAVNRPSRPAAVTLVTEGNRFLETALALRPDLEVTTILPEDFETTRPADSSNSLTIFDAYVPITTTLPGGSLLFVAPPRSSELFTVTGVVENPAPVAADPEDPLLAHLELGGVSVLDSAEIPLPDWARLVIAGDTLQGSSPLLFAGEVGGRRAAVLAFDLRRSDLPLQVAFPVLLSNLTSWLAPSQFCIGPAGDPGQPDAGQPGDAPPAAPCAGLSLPDEIRPGQAVAFTPPLEAGEVSLTRPDGSRLRLAPQAGQVLLGDLDQLGVYRLDWGAQGGAQFAVNLFSPGESDILPAPTLPLAGIETGAAGQLPQQARQEWWRPLAFAALALLVAEWLIYQRMTLARVVRSLRLKVTG
jgi:hypothetical protein